jgi:signal transduction histidine kinase
MEPEEEQGQPERTRLLRRIVLSQEEDRRRIARDLHDHFGQQLSTSIFRLAMLKEKCHEPEIFAGLVALDADLKQLDADVDALVHELRPSALDDLGLAAALSKHCERWSEHSGIPVGFFMSGIQEHRIPNAIETALYRIAQEALNNVA